MDQLRLGDVYSGRIKSATVIGCGALGSEVALRLAKIGVDLTMIDDDKIEGHNIPNQLLYGPNDVGRLKVDVLAERIRMLTDVEVKTSAVRVDATSSLKAEAVFACVDSMAARKAIFGAAMDGNSTTYLFDGRMGARSGTAIGIDLRHSRNVSHYVLEWLYDDKDVILDRAACGTILSIGATASLCAANLVWQFMNLTSISPSALPVESEDEDENEMHDDIPLILRRPVQQFDTELGTAWRMSL